MKKIISIAAGLLLSGIVTAQPGQIVISDSARNAVRSELGRMNKSFTVNPQQTQAFQQNVRTWVSGSINLKKATVRESERFNRVTYKQELLTDRNRVMSERLAMPSAKKVKAVPKLQVRDQKAVKLTTPLTVLYREGPNYFKYGKLREEKAQKPIQESVVMENARKFILENSFIKESQRDRIGLAYVQNRRINEDRGDSLQAVDYLVQQDVVFERYFDNKPVVNSMIKVGIYPETKEIILFEHFNWPVLQEDKETMLASDMLMRAGSGSPQDLITRLERKIRQENKIFTRAEVRNAFPGWFQSKEGLIPVMCFNVRIEQPGQEGVTTRDYLEVLNIAGSDDVFFEDRKEATKPARPQ